MSITRIRTERTPHIEEGSAEHGASHVLTTISVVIPTLNEAANLPHVLTRLPDCVDEVVLVDGHSIDDTIAVARAILPDIRVVFRTGAARAMPSHAALPPRRVTSL